MDRPVSRGIEKAIEEAIQRGEFEDLPGKGKPLDLTDYFEAPEDRRLAQMLLKNAQILPREVELLREIATLEQDLSTCQDAGRQELLRKSIEARRLNFRLLTERQRKR